MNTAWVRPLAGVRGLFVAIGQAAAQALPLRQFEFRVQQVDTSGGVDVKFTRLAALVLAATPLKRGLSEAHRQTDRPGKVRRVAVQAA